MDLKTLVLIQVVMHTALKLNDVLTHTPIRALSSPDGHYPVYGRACNHLHADSHHSVYDRISKYLYVDRREHNYTRYWFVI